MAGVLQEAGDADSRARIRSQVYVEYFIIPYTSTCIRLSHLYEQFCLHCLLIMNDGGWDRWRVVDSHQGVDAWTGGRYCLIVFCFFYLCFCLLSLISCLLLSE